MKKSYFLWLAVSVVIMFVLPWLAVTFVKGDGGMAVCFLLFFAVNPIYSAIIGVFAGKSIRYLWSLPVISATLFLIGTWTFFDMKETAFILYACVYLILGTAAMLISMFIRKRHDLFTLTCDMVHGSESENSDTPAPIKPPASADGERSF